MAKISIFLIITKKFNLIYTLIISLAHNLSKNTFQGRMSMLSTRRGRGSLLIRIAFFTVYSSTKAFNPRKCRLEACSVAFTSQAVDALTFHTGVLKPHIVVQT